MSLRPLAWSALLVGMALPATAQGVGTRIPEIKLEGFSQTEAKSFDDYYGRAVLLEFFAYWCVPCASSVPHVNELQEALGGKGLSVLGVTDEPSSMTEPWIEKHQAAYAYAYDKGGKLQSWLGIDGIPHAVLVGPNGTILWRGHPASLTESVLEEHLAGTLAQPLFQWPPSAQGVAKRLVKGDLAGALEDARALSGDGAQVANQIQGLIDSRVAQVESWFAAGNYLDVVEGGGDLSKGLKGLEVQAKVDALVAKVDGVENAKDVLKAQKQIRKLRSKEPSKRKDIERQIEDLEDIRDGLRGTYAAEEAGAYIDQLREMLIR